MSGIKQQTTVVSVAHLNNLQAQASRASSLQTQNEIMKRMESTQRKLLNQYERRVETLNSTVQGLLKRVGEAETARSAQIERVRSQFSTQIDAIAQSSSVSMREMHKQMLGQQEALEKRFNSLANDVADALEAHNAAVSQRIQEAEDRLNRRVEDGTKPLKREMGRLADRITAIETSNSTLLEMAREYRRQAAACLEETRAYPHGLAASGGAEALEAALGRADENIRRCVQMPTNAPAACQSASDAAELAIDLLNRAIMQEELWHLERHSTDQALSAVEAQAAAARILAIEEEAADGTLVSMQVDVDYWANGELTQLQKRVEALRAAYVDKRACSEDFKAMRAAAAQIAKEIQAVMGFANLAYHEGQNRIETAADFCSELSARGFRLTAHGYQNDDVRGAYRFHMRDSVIGDEIIITQTPRIDDSARFVNDLQFEFCSDVLNEDVFVRRGRDMRQVLRLAEDENHCGEGEIKTVPGFESRPSKSVALEQWQQQAQKLPQPAIAQVQSTVPKQD